jgi:hypothetical protein
MNIFNSFRAVYSEKKYWAISLAVAILFYVLNVLVLSFSTVKSFFEIEGIFKGFDFLFTLSLGLHEAIKFYSFVGLILTSILLGILVSLITYKVRAQAAFSKKTSLLTSFGIFFAALAPGCAACGLGLAPLIGLGAFITFLPFDGFEITFLAIIFLAIAIWKVSKGLLVCENCQNYLLSRDKMKGGLNGRKRKN